MFLVTTRDEMIVQQYLVGVFERTVTEADMERFLGEVNRKYRAGDPGLRSQIVYTGEQVSPELTEKARRRASSSSPSSNTRA